MIPPVSTSRDVIIDVERIRLDSRELRRENLDRGSWRESMIFFAAFEVERDGAKWNWIVLARVQGWNGFLNKFLKTIFP